MVSAILRWRWCLLLFGSFIIILTIPISEALIDDPPLPCTRSDFECQMLVEEEEGIKDGEEDDEHSQDDSKILSCVFSAVPFIGGMWLSRLAREWVPDTMLLEATNSFVDGGELVIRLMGLKPPAQPVMLFRSLRLCFDVEETDNEEEELKYTWEERDKSGDTINLTPNSKSSPSVPPSRRKRRDVKGGKYGKDPLYAFALLGLLIVGAMIAYLVYLLTAM